MNFNLNKYNQRKKKLLALITLLSVQTFAQNQEQYEKLAGNYLSNDSSCELSLTIDNQGKYIVKLDDKYRDLGQIDTAGDSYGNYVSFSGVTSYQREDEGLVFQNYGNSMNYYLNFEECGEKFVYLTKDEGRAYNIDLSNFFRCTENDKPLAFPITQEQFTCFYAKDDSIDNFYLKPKYQAQTKAFTEQELKFEIKGRSFGFVFLKPDMQYFEVAKFDLDGFTYKLIIYNCYGLEDATLLNTQINSYDKEGNLIDALLLDSRFSYEKVKAFSKFTINKDLIYIDKYITYTAESDGEIGDPIPEDQQIPEIAERLQYTIDEGKFNLIYEYDAEVERHENQKMLEENMREEELE